MRRLHPAMLLLSAVGVLRGAAADAPPVLGDGDHRYAWVHDWAKLPVGVRYGGTHGCIVIDSKDRIYEMTGDQGLAAFVAGFLIATGALHAAGIGLAVVAMRAAPTAVLRGVGGAIAAASALLVFQLA